MIKLFENYNQIAEICEEYKIENWTLNADGSIDVVGDIKLWDRDLIELPLKFGRVDGYFDFSHNNLTTLEGCPREVGGYFNCMYNKLTTLEGAPRVGGYFYFTNDNLPEYLIRFVKLNRYSQPIIKQILKWQDEYELWKNPEIFAEKFKRMMEDIQENDLPDIKIKFPR